MERHAYLGEKRRSVWKREASINLISIPKDMHCPLVLSFFLPGRGPCTSSEPILHGGGQSAVCVCCQLLTKSTKQKQARKSHSRQTERLWDLLLSWRGKEGSPRELSSIPNLWLSCDWWSRDRCHLPQHLLASLKQSGWRWHIVTKWTTGMWPLALVCMAPCT